MRILQSTFRLIAALACSEISVKCDNVARDLPARSKCANWTRRKQDIKVASPLAMLALLACFSAPALAQTGSPALLQQLGSKLVGTGPVATPQEGYSVALSADGDTAAVGGYSDGYGEGAVWIYTQSGGVWTQQGGKLVGTGGGGSNSWQGYAVALSGDGNTLVEGGRVDNGNYGAIWVFTRTGGVWSQQGGKLIGTVAVGTAQQGASVSVSADGNTVVEGGFSDNGGAGAVWVFTRSGGVWTQQGTKLVGTGATGSAEQGTSVGLSGDGNTLFLGGPDDNGGIGAGWIFTRVAGTWSQLAGPLVGTGATGTANQGYSVSLSADGKTSLTGGPNDNSGVGGAWIFTKSAGVWSQLGGELVGTDAVGAASQGNSVRLSADGNSAIVGGDNDNGNVGAAWIFTQSLGVWSQMGNKLIGTGESGNSVLGLSVALSGDGETALAGGTGDNSSQGAAWLFSTNTSFAPLNVGVTATQTIAVQFSSNFTLGNIGVLTQGAPNLDYTLAGSQPSSGACTIGAAYVAGNICSVNIQFAATAPGLRAGAILFYDNAGSPNLVTTIFISGTGLAPQAEFVGGLISTAAGTGVQGDTGDAGPAVTAEIAAPYGMAVDGASDLYLYQGINAVVREVTGSSGVITAVAGNGTNGYSGNGGAATAAEISNGDSLTIDGAGNLYVADTQNNVVREVHVATGIITTIAGDSNSGYSGDGLAASSAELSRPVGVAVDGSGNLYITDINNNVIRKVYANTGIIVTVAGVAGTPGYTGDGGQANSAELNGPLADALDAAGNLYFCDDNNNVIRRLDAFTGIITTVAGFAPGGGYTGDGGAATSAQLNDPEGVTFDAAGNLYIADSGNNVMRKVAAGTNIITTIAGNATAGYAGDGGSATAALISYPVTPVINGAGDLYFADSSNNVVREVTGVAPLIFGTVNVNFASAAQDVTVTNDGSAALTLSSLTASVNFNLSGADTTCTGTTTLAPGGGCVLGIEFIPTAAGPLTGSITLVGNAGTQTVPLSGTGALNATAMALATSLSPAFVGQSVTFTATVSPTPTGSPLGTVNFYNSSTLLGSGTVDSSGVATFATATLPVGSNSITATYSGNASSATSTSSALTEMVDPLTVTTTALVTSLNPAVSGQSVTFTATMTPTPTGTPLGTVNFYNGSTLLGAVAVDSSGVATFVSSTLPVGADNITAAYGGNADFGSSTSNLISETITAVVTATALTSSPNPAIAGQSVTLTATVTPVPTGTPLGTVNFYNEATLLGTANINGSGVATFATSSLPVGVDSPTAVYSGNATFATSTSPIAAETVNLAPTATALTSSLNSAVAGQSVTFTATVSPSPTGSPLGSVNFYNGSALLGSAAVNSSGVATFTTSGLPSGSNSITATYSGNANFAASTSSAFTETVLAVTATALASSHNPSSIGQSVTFSATVSPSPTGSPLGTVNFYNSSALLGTGSLNSSGIATFAISSLATGSDNITATYSGNAGFATSTSAIMSQTILIMTTTTLSASPSPGVASQPLTLTATISPIPVGGTVNFYNSTTLLGTATVNSSGLAIFTTSSLTAGSYSITAVYSGNASSGTSTSSVVSLTVTNTAGFTVTAPAGPFIVSQGGSINISISVPPQGGAYNNVVTMSATGLPSGATAIFNPPAVTPGSTGATTVLTIELAALISGTPSGPPVAPQRPMPFIPIGVGLAACTLICGFTRVKVLRLGFAIVALAGIAVVMAGCHGGFAAAPTTTAGNYVVTVTGTNGAVHASTTFTLVVH